MHVVLIIPSNRMAGARVCEVVAVLAQREMIRGSRSLVNIVMMGHAVAQLVEALRYKPECRGFDSRWCHWNFSLI